MVIDHINHNGLDNRIENLRLVTPKQNQANRRGNKTNSTSKYKGVGWDKQKNKWRAQIKIKGKTTFIGRYDNQKTAALEYDKKAYEIYGKYAYLNFPGEIDNVKT